MVKMSRIMKYLDIDKSKALGYFYRVCEGAHSVCGSWGIIFLNKKNNMSFNIIVGKCTNNREKVYALWAMLKISLERDLTIL